MLPVIKIVTAAAFEVTGIAVNGDDVVAVHGVLIGDFQNIPGIFFKRGIGEADMVINGFMQRFPHAL